MKKVVFYILLLCCASCIDRHIDNSLLLPELQQAEELMYAHTDNALHILQQMPKPSSKQSLQHATYALLLAEAQYKSDISQNDSLINIACDYFLPRENHQRKALSIYLKGCILNEQHREDEALPLLLQADEEVQLTDDYRLGHLNAAEIGILYSYRNLWKYAMEYLQKSLDYAQKSKDDTYISSAYTYIARIYDANNEYDKAIITYQKALDIAPKGSYSLFVNLHELSHVYRDLNKQELALEYEKRAYELGKDKYNLDQVNLALGRLYDYFDQTDSAQYFLNLAKESSNIRTARGAYGTLRRISRETRDFESADKYATIILDLQDSINTINRESTLIEMQEKYDQQKVINEKNQIQLQMDRIIGISLICIIILTIIIAIIYYNNNRKKDIIRTYAIRLIENDNLLEKNRIQIEELQSQINESENNEELKLAIENLQKEEGKLKEENISLNTILDNFKKSISNKDSEINKLYGIIEANQTKGEYIISLQEKLKEHTPILRKLKKKPTYIEEKQWKEIKEVADLFFNRKLDEIHPNLSEADIELICLIKFDFTDKDIATMLAISESSVYKRKQRLKEHLQKSQISINSVEDWIRTI